MFLFESEIASSYFLEGENLLFIRLKNLNEFSIDRVLKNYEITNQKLGDRSVHVLIDSREIDFLNVPKEVLHYMGNNPYTQFQLSNAILINGLGQRILANFYLKVVKPQVKTRVFNDRSLALQWLNVPCEESFNKAVA